MRATRRFSSLPVCVQQPFSVYLMRMMKRRKEVKRREDKEQEGRHNCLLTDRTGDAISLAATA